MQIQVTEATCKHIETYHKEEKFTFVPRGEMDVKVRARPI